MREESEKELGERNLNWMQSYSEFYALKIDFNECQGNVEYYQEKFAQIQFEMMDKIGKYEDLNKKYVQLESCLTGFAKEKNKRECFEVV